MRGLMDRDGEQIGYVRGSIVYTMEDEVTGQIVGDKIVDIEGNPIWHLRGDGVYRLDKSEAIGYLTQERSEE